MEDLRIRTTKNMIHQALIRLLKSKPLEKITVVELCKQAQVNRSTFYKYYGSQYDVLEDIVQNLFHQLGEFSVKSQSGPQKMIFSKEMLAFLLEHKQLCQTLLDCVPSPYFQNKLLNILQYDDSFSKKFSDKYSEEQKRILFAYYQHGCFGIMSHWLHSETPMSVDQLFDVMYKLRQNIMFK